MATDDAAGRVRRWWAAKDTQERFAIYIDHPAGDRLGGMDRAALMSAYHADLEDVARVAVAGPPADVLAAAERVENHHFHEDEPSPLAPDASECVRDDCLTLARWVRGGRWGDGR